MKKENIMFKILLIMSFITLAYIIPKVYFQNDTFYSIKIGESILKNGVDMIDHFSWIPNLAYTYPHWLFDVIIYLIHNSFGNFGIYIFVILSFLSLICLMYYVCKKLTNDKYISFIVTLFASIALRDFAAARAQLLTYPLLLFILFSIYRLRETDNKKHIISIFISSLLIANMHVAVWPFVFVLFMPFVVSDIIYLITKKLNYDVPRHFNIDIEKSKLKITSLALLSCFITGFMTPNFLVPFTYYIKTAMGISTSNISEHIPITISGNEFIFILLLIVVILLLNKKSKIKLNDLFLLCGLFLLAFLSKRNSFLLVILGSIPIARLFKNVSFFDLKIVIMNRVFYCILFVIMLSSFLVVFSRTKYKYIDTDYYPKKAVDYIKENIDLDNSKIFNEYNYGSYLMLRGIKVFVDSRADLYLEEFNKDCHIFEDFIYLDDNYDEIFKKYGVTHVLLSNGNKVHKYMKNDNGYKKLYKDSNFTIYEVLN